MKRNIWISYQCLLLLSLVISTISLQAQKFKYSIPGIDSLEKAFIVSGASSTLLKNGEAEIIVNNTLTSYWTAIHQTNNDSPVLDRVRQTQFISDIYGYYGVSPSGRWDIGLNLRYSRVRIDRAASSSMFRVFNSEKDIIENDPSSLLNNSLGALSSIGVRARVKPLRTDPRLVINGGFAIKTVTGEDKAARIGADRNFADIGATYYKALNNNTYYYAGLSGLVYFPSPNVTDEYLFNTSANFFLIQRTNNNKFTFYPGLVYSLSFRPRASEFQKNALLKTTEFVLAYGGVQYALNSNYNFFLLGGFPLLSEATNPQQEIVRASYSTITLGFRVGL